MKNIAYIILSIFLCTACDISDNKVEVLDQYVRIYDNASFSQTYTPIDVKNTPDGGFLILGETDLDDSPFPGIYLLKVDAEGNVDFDQILDSDFVFPIGNFMTINNEYYFFCMQQISLNVHLVKVDAAGQVSPPIPIADGDGNPVLYPLHASKIGADQFLLQSYDKEEKETVISQLNSSGTILKKRSFTIGIGDQEVIEEPIIRHFTRNGRKFPFLTGTTATNEVYFNGFYNFTFSMVFVNLDDEDADPSVLQGVNDGAGISAALHLENNTYATSRFSFGENYILPQVQIEVGPTSPASTEDLVGNSFPELVPDAPVQLKKLNISGREVLLYGSSTRGGQILLMAYDATSGILLGTRYLGFSNPYEIASFVPTSDQGLAVVGTTYVAGRFPRVCLFRLNLDDLNALAQIASPE